MSGRSPDEGRYSKVSRRMWNDEHFRGLSRAKPNAQTLWQRLLTGPELGCIPGLFPAREGGLADALEWPLVAFRRCWLEIAAKEMAEADWRAGLVWVPNGIVHNEPQSTNAIIGWRLALRELPECELKHRAIDGLRAHLTGMGPAWVAAFESAVGEVKSKPKQTPSATAIGKPSPMAKAMPSPMASETPSRIQEQEQDSREEPRSVVVSGSQDLTGLPRMPVRQIGDGARGKEPTNLQESLELPIAERAHWIADGPGAVRADWMQPHLWPEVKAVAEALANATGKPSHARLSSYGRDAGVKALVEAFATGWSQAELERAVVFVVRSDWWTKDRATRGLSSLSQEVIRRAITASEHVTSARRPELSRAPRRTPEEMGCVPPPPGLLEGLGLPAHATPIDAVAAIVGGAVK